MTDSGRTAATESRAPRRAWLVAGLGFTVVALLGGSTGVWYAMAGLVPEKTVTQHAGFNRSADRIEISLSSGNIELRGTSAPGIQLDRTLTWHTDQPTVSEQWTDGTLRITSACADHGCAADYLIRLPAWVAVRARTGHGVISTDGLTGRQDLVSSAGDIRVSGAAGQLTAQTLSGNITGLGLRSEWSDLHTVAGTVTARYTTAPAQLTADSDAGDIVVAVPRAARVRYRVLAFTATAAPDVKVAQDPAGTATISATTLAGTIRIGYP